MDVRDRLAATPKILAHLLVEATEAQLDAVAGEEWAVRTVVAHLRDDEYLCMRVALERMLAEDRPALHFLDGADWEPGRNRTRDRKELLLADFALQRQASISILNMLRPEDLLRTGMVSDDREVTIERFLEAWADHDAEHIAQIEHALGETYEEAVARRQRRE